MAIERDEVELKPCPFCGDPMVIKLGLLQHVEQGDCLIGANAWDESALGRWMRRRPAAKPAARTRNRSADWEWP